MSRMGDTSNPSTRHFIEKIIMMKRSFIIVLLIAASSTLICVSWNSETSSTPSVTTNAPNREGFNTTDSPLPTTLKHDVAVVVGLDGTIYIVETNSRKILSSFTSGSSIYSSYQSPKLENDTYFDCGDDFEVYEIDNRSYKKKLSAKEYLLTRRWAHDGAVRSVSTDSIIFILDGRTICTYIIDSDAKCEELVVDLGTIEELLIQRKDRKLAKYYIMSRKVLWALEFSLFVAFIPSGGNEKDSGWTWVDVYQFRDHVFSDSSSVFNRLSNARPVGTPGL